MKKLIFGLSIVAVLGLLTMTSPPAFGQPSDQTTTTVTSTGTVSEFTPTDIVVRANTTTAPVRYTFTKTTTYVDENGNPVSIRTVKTGAPVVVYYEKNGDNLVADKVVVKKTVTTTTDASPPVTVVQPPVVVTQPQSTPPAVDGFVKEADSDEISVRTPSSPDGAHYSVHDATAFVDENNNPVPKDALKRGMPVTVFYEQDGDHLLATRVVVKNSIPSGP